MCACAAAAVQVVGLRVDRATAHVLQHADMHANDKGEIQVGCVQVRQGRADAMLAPWAAPALLPRPSAFAARAPSAWRSRCAPAVLHVLLLRVRRQHLTQQGSFQWALWVNTSKNPRLKAVEMSALRMLVEVPKQIALANIAMRVQLHEKVRRRGGALLTRQACGAALIPWGGAGGRGAAAPRGHACLAGQSTESRQGGSHGWPLAAAEAMDRRDKTMPALPGPSSSNARESASGGLMLLLTA